jgi:hypothetical protein
MDAVKQETHYTYGTLHLDGGETRTHWWDKLREKWRRWGSESRPPITATNDDAPTRTRAYLQQRQLTIDAAALLYDNRLGWSANRQPYAPRAFWCALGIALGKDTSWVESTAESLEDARLTRRAALELLEDLRA